MVRLLEAEFALSMGDEGLAARRLNEALAGVAESETIPLRASVLRRAGAVFSQIGALREAVTAQQEAARLYLETAQLDRASSALIELAWYEIEWVGEIPPAQAARVVVESYQHMMLGAEIAARLGRPLDSARAFMWAGLIAARVGRPDAGQLLDRAQRLALSTAHYGILAELFEQRALVSEEQGETELAAEQRRRSEVFAAAAAASAPVGLATDGDSDDTSDSESTAQTE